MLDEKDKSKRIQEIKNAWAKEAEPLLNLPYQGGLDGERSVKLAKIGQKYSKMLQEL